MAKPRTLTGGQQSQADAVSRLQAHHVHLAQRQQRGWVEPAIPMDALDTARHEGLYALHETPHENRGGLDPRGVPAFKEGMVMRMSRAGHQANPRDRLTMAEVAALVSTTVPTVLRGLAKCGIKPVQHGGDYGRRELFIEDFEKYLTCVGYAEDRRTILMASARMLSHGQSA